MKKKIGIIAFLIVCAAVIGAAINAGENHPDNCRECKWAVGKYYNESDKFAACK